MIKKSSVDKKTAIKYWKKAYKKGHPRYSRKQIAEALKKYTDFDVRKPITEGEAGNPYDLENCSAYGWVTYFVKDGEPFLPVDYTIGRHGE